MEERGAGYLQPSPEQDRAPERPVKSHPELPQYGEEGCEERRATLEKHLGGKISSPW